MREFVILGCVVAVAACARGGAAGGDTSRADSATVAGPPATTLPAPAPPADSIVSRPRTPTGTATPGTKSPASTTVPAAGAPDSVRGRVSVTGTSFEKHVMVEAANGKRTEITGAVASLIGHASGTDVMVWGTPSGTTFNATRFIVRTVEGAPAIDGTLKTEGPSLYIITADGTRTRIATPPPPLLGRDGTRVWITGDPSKGVSSFGFIDPPR